MKFRICLILGIVLNTQLLFAQTWDGSAGSNWNDPANWSTNTVPAATANVTIPASGGIVNWPQLTSANVTVGSLSMGAGSALDVNGFELTLSGSLSINPGTGLPATISNSSNNGVVINLAGAATKYIGRAIFTHAVTFNLSGSHSFYDGYGGATVYREQVTFNAGNSGVFQTCHNYANEYQGDLTVIRTASGTTNLFYSGFSTLSGDFSYTNQAGGNSAVNPNGLPASPAAAPLIGGKIQVDVRGGGDFSMFHLVNNTAGGTVFFQDIGQLDLRQDTLIASVTVSGFGVSGNDFFYQNKITGDVSLADKATNSASTYMGANHITGNTAITVNSAAPFYNGYGVGRDRFDGNTSYTINGAGLFQDSHNFANEFNGNLTVNRTASGTTNLFYSGFSALTGNFTYTNQAGGNSAVNPGGLPASPAAAPVIGGKIQVDVRGGGDFSMFHLVNNTAGGAVFLEDIGQLDLRRDTLTASVTVSGFGVSGNDFFYQNKITGDVSLADKAANSGATYMGGNHITGNTAITVNSAAPFYNGYGVGRDRFDGSTNYTLNGAGLFQDSHSFANEFNGNLTVNRITSGTTNLFYSGFSTLRGDFSYTNQAGGNSAVNPNGLPASPAAAPVIGGAVAMLLDAGGTGSVGLFHLVNNTPGGSITIANAAALTIDSDTLKADLTVSGYTGASNDNIRRNQITGDFTLTEAADNTGSTYFGANRIIGSTMMVTNSSAPFYTGYAGADVFDGDFSLTKNGSGFVTLGNSYPTDFNGNVVINSASGVSPGAAQVTFGGSMPATFTQSGAQPIVFSLLRINKTENATLTLNSELGIGSNLTFDSGNIVASASAPIVFMDGSVHTNASASSHVIGVVKKSGNDAFTFPVGSYESYSPVAMTAPGAFSDVFSAEYQLGNPNSDGYDTESHGSTIEKVSNCEYWNIKRLNGTSNVALTFTYGNPCGGSSYIADPGQAAIVHWNGAGWDDLGNGGSTGTTGGTIATAGPVSSFSPFTIASKDLDLNPLPVTLISFSVIMEHENPLLNWSTTHEENLSHFEVEKSSDGRNWRIAGIVLAEAGRENSHEYQFADAAAYITGTLSGYYRLKMVDIGGAFTYSAIIRLDQASKEEEVLLVYPNAASDRIYISENHLQLVTGVRFFTLGGTLIRDVVPDRQGISVSDLPDGIYLLSFVFPDGTTITRRLLVKKK